MLTAKQFYKGALLLPLVVSLPAIASLGSLDDGPWISRLILIFWMVGAFPYLILLFYLWGAVNKAETMSDLRKVLYRGPLLFFAGVCIVHGFGLLAALMENNRTGILESLSILAGALIFGYGYVLLTQTLYHAGCHLGGIRPWEDAAGADAGSGEGSE